MVVIKIPANIGDEIIIISLENFKHTFYIKHFEKNRICVVSKFPSLSSSYFEKKFRIDHCNEMVIVKSQVLDKNTHIFHSKVSDSQETFEIGKTYIDTKSLCHFYLRKIYGDLVKYNHLVNFFTHEKLFFHITISKFFEHGLVGFFQHSPDSPIFEFYINETEYHNFERLNEKFTIQNIKDLYFNMMSLNPGDKGFIIKAHKKVLLKIKDTVLDLDEPWNKKVSFVDGTVFVKARELSYEFVFFRSSVQKRVRIRNGMKYGKIFHTKDSEDILGVIFDNERHMIKAEIIDKSFITEVPLIDERESSRSRT